ncbi:hypothetical protein ISN44_As06g016370 [Arabidopsis suecica]|uniref:Uncharacterized protein n=1 Tax=Arabidopsis suecica TaxID=45249 RepID=A0A8T2CCM6_ARASU|nr:hypothetical protein ISN44_As06g016370 [Arabidopsis suecica]
MISEVDETFGSGIDKLKETIANQNEKIDTRITALLSLLRSWSTEEENPQIDAFPASPQLPDSPNFNRPDPKPSYVINVNPKIPKASSSSTRRYKLHQRISLEEINERRLKGLCVFCEQPETPDHHIKHRNTGILMIDGDEDQTPNCEFGESIEHFTVSLLSTAQDEKPNLENHENLVHETILEGESVPQFQVPISDSESLRNIELREENSKLETLEYVVMNENENLEQEWVQNNVNKRFEVDGDVERSQKLISNTKNCSAHQLFDKMSQYKERLGIKKKRKGFKSRMFKYKSGFRKLHALTFSKSMRMIETSSDLLLLNGKDSPARTAMGFKLEACEITSSNQERLELCTENNGYLESSNLELVLMKEEPESVKVNGVKLWTQSCNLKSDLIQGKMIVKKTNSLRNDESVCALEDFSSAVLEENQSQLYCDAFHSGGVFRFWKFTCSDMIPLGETVLTKGQTKTVYKLRRFKFKHRVAPRDFKSGLEVRGKQTAMWQRKANKEYLCLFWTNNVAACDHILLGGEMKINGYKLCLVRNKKQQRKPPKYPTTWKLRYKNMNLQRTMIHLDTQLLIFRWDSMYIRHFTTFEHHLEDSHPQSGFGVKGDVKYKYPRSSAKVALIKMNKFSKTWFMLKGDCFKEDSHIRVWDPGGSIFRNFSFKLKLWFLLSGHTNQRKKLHGSFSMIFSGNFQPLNLVVKVLQTREL